MPWFIQMVWFTVMLLGIALALWIGFWLLLALFSLGVIAVIWSHLRDFLLAKGILNPTPGVPPMGAMYEETTTTTTLIEGDFTRVDDAENVKSDER